jgi:hypothetical protein
MRFTAKWDTAGSNATGRLLSQQGERHRAGAAWRATAGLNSRFAHVSGVAKVTHEKKPPRFLAGAVGGCFLGVCAGDAERETPQTQTI